MRITTKERVTEKSCALLLPCKNPREGAEPRPYAPHGSILHRADRVVRLYERVINSA